MTVALITIVLVVAGGWLLYRDPPKQRPGEALSKFDRLAQTVHELIQGRWYGKVAATVAVIVAGLLASTLFSSEPLTASTKTVTVTVTTKAATGTTGPPSTPTETATNPAPKPSRSVLGTWSGIVVDQDDASKKFYDHAVCWTTGERTTNGEDGRSIDDGNPQLYTSNYYYGVQMGGTFGYVSWTWIHPDYRGGLGLPAC